MLDAKCGFVCRRLQHFLRVIQAFDRHNQPLLSLQFAYNALSSLNLSVPASVSHKQSQHTSAFGLGLGERESKSDREGVNLRSAVETDADLQVCIMGVVYEFLCVFVRCVRGCVCCECLFCV